MESVRREPDCGSRGRNSVSMARIFGRPFAIVVQEPILLFTSLYLALVYDVLYLFFQALTRSFSKVSKLVWIRPYKAGRHRIIWHVSECGCAFRVSLRFLSMSRNVAGCGP